eukprot:CAMPEP_0170588234 /NCGR_PEP_ID=MMETSP0224-20130122/10721_1 /TAXON_ID=285029 /ORGANISM="Togula jolla, Strain CCCM 725" /LENGTH=479 /DNA_ID=CAMNT_0010911937 /DNA_START=49 /DNA_END=1488 /DNA_ORIENTATION=+
MAEPAEPATSESSSSEKSMAQSHSWSWCIFCVCSLSMCITTDILQYAMPLAFLPSVLEDRGHSILKITTAIGVYYWTGFLGGVMITTYQIWKFLHGEVQGTADQGMTLTRVRRQLVYLLVCLGIGTATLVSQAIFPTFLMHTVSRFLQGFSGAFIFFYAFLLSVQLFRGSQQVFAMTAVSCALNVAEVMGSGLGAAVFDAYGHGAVFWLLAGMSILNQLMLVVVYVLVGRTATPDSQAAIPAAPPPDPTALVDSWARKQSWAAGFDQLKKLLRGQQLLLAVALVTTAALVKGSVEEALPFHADHQWHLGPLKIGQAFTVIACAYIFAAILAARLWTRLGRFRLPFCGFWLALLGAACWLLFSLARFNLDQHFFMGALILYGVCLGMTHTPAALLVAEAIEGAEDGVAKDVANGVWNTMWEAGGSLGFLLGGLLSSSYHLQLRLMGSICVMCLLVAAALSASSLAPAAKSAKSSSYGSTA